MGACAPIGQSESTREAGFVVLVAGGLMMLRAVFFGFRTNERLAPVDRLFVATSWYIGVGALPLGSAYVIGSFFSDSEVWGVVILGVVVAGVALVAHLKVVELEHAEASRPLSAWERLVSDRCQTVRIGGGVAAVTFLTLAVVM